jgi:hypothetical protein
MHPAASGCTLGRRAMTKVKPLSGTKIRKAVTDFLFSFPFFESLTAEELLHIAEYINFLEIEPEETLFREGDQAECVSFAVDGELDVIMGSKSGKEGGIDSVVISTLSKG